jgi:thioredoxin-like negative regulator of GroEL
LKQEIPDALLFIAPGCPHCPTVLAGLAELVKQAQVGRLEVINIAIHPQRAEQLGVRSVPWLKLGEFELHGLHSAAELRRWAQRAGSAEGMADYLSEQFKSGQLQQVIGMVKQQPAHLSVLLELAAQAQTELTVRIGVSAVLEEMAGSPELAAQLPALRELAASDDPRVRADASHFLALSGDPAAEPVLEALTEDPERSVRETAADSLAELRDSIR